MPTTTGLYQVCLPDRAGWLCYEVDDAARTVTLITASAAAA